MRRTGAVLMLALLSLLLNPAGCRESNSAPPGKTGAASPGQSGKSLRLQLIRCNDPQGFGIEAFTMLAPAGWRFEGGVKWVLDNPAMPARAAFRIFNPDGREEFEASPAMGFAWSTSPLFHATMPPGSRYFGNEVLAPMDAAAALRQIFVPRMRGRMAGLRVVQEQEIPEAAAALAGQGAASGASQASAAKLRLEYQSEGRWLEEEVSGAAIRYDFPVPSFQGMATQTMWVLDYLWSCKAERGALDKIADLCGTMARSFRINPRWFARYNQLTDMLVRQQIQHINSLGELSRYISRTNDEISNMMMESYRQRQAAQDRVAENFSRYIRGVDEYVTPDRDRVELPSGYRHAWRGPNNEYILTDDPNFNPNLGSNQTWTELKRVP